MTDMSAHIPLQTQSARAWTGHSLEWIHTARCSCGWTALTNTEMLASVTAQDHARVQNGAAELRNRAGTGVSTG